MDVLTTLEIVFMEIQPHLVGEIQCVMLDDSGIALATDKGHHSLLSLRKYYRTTGSEQLRETIQFLRHKFVSRTILCRLPPGQNYEALLVKEHFAHDR